MKNLRVNTLIYGDLILDTFLNDFILFSKMAGSSSERVVEPLENLLLKIFKDLKTYK